MFKNPFRTLLSSDKTSSLTARRTFLPPGYTTSYSASLCCSTQLDAQFLELIDSVLLQPIISTNLLTDLRGCLADQAICTLTGTIDNGSEQLPLTFSITTKFYDFPSRNEIRHQHATLSNAELATTLSAPTTLSEIGALPGLAIERISIGIELFTSTILTRLSGFGPIAAERVVLELLATKLQISIEAEALATTMSLPLLRDDILGKLTAIIKSRYQFSLISDYTRHQGELR